MALTTKNIKLYIINNYYTQARQRSGHNTHHNPDVNSTLLYYLLNELLEVIGSQIERNIINRWVANVTIATHVLVHTGTKAWQPLASYPGPLIEGEEKGPGTYCTRVRRLYPKKTWGAANDYTLFRSPLAPRVRSDVISV